MLESLYQSGSATIASHSANLLDEGGEHIVERADADGRVIKHTKGAFGFKLVPTASGTAAELQWATPAEYVDRIHAQNELFGDDTRIEGVSKAYNDHVGLTVSQKYLKGEHPSQLEMEAHLKGLGFVQSKPQMLGNKDFETRTWYHPASGYMVTDAKPDNFIKDASGKLHVIDLMVQSAPPGSQMEKLMNFSLPRIVRTAVDETFKKAPKAKVKGHEQTELI